MVDAASIYLQSARTTLFRILQSRSPPSTRNLEIKMKKYLLGTQFCLCLLVEMLRPKMVDIGIRINVLRFLSPYRWPKYFSELPSVNLGPITLVVLALLPLVVLAITEYLFQSSVKETGLFKSREWWEEIGFSQICFAILRFAGSGPCRPFLSGSWPCYKNHGTILSFTQGRRSKWGTNVVGRLFPHFGLFHALSGSSLLALGSCLFISSQHHLNQRSPNLCFRGVRGNSSWTPNGSYVYPLAGGVLRRHNTAYPTTMNHFRQEGIGAAYLPEEFGRLHWIDFRTGSW